MSEVDQLCAAISRRLELTKTNIYYSAVEEFCKADERRARQFIQYLDARPAGPTFSAATRFTFANAMIAGMLEMDKYDPAKAQL